MAKRYLGIDEAAEILGITKDELNRLRTKGEIRGFADRGTFKFKEEDVAEMARRMQPSSDPDVPMIDGADDGSVLDDEPSADGSGLDGAPSIIRRLSGGAPSSQPDSDDAAGSIFDDFGSGGASDSDVRLVMDDRLDSRHDSGQDVLLQMGESDSDVRLSSDDRSGKISLGDSDSDVRLSADSGIASSSDIKLGMSDSDSDVRLDGDSKSRLAMPDPDSDSDVMLAPTSADSGRLVPKPDSDSDVMLVSEEPDSDSDVHLAGDEGSGLNFLSQSDSDVRLVSHDSDSDVQLLDDARVAGPRSKIKKDSDSDVAVLPDSGLNLDSPASGIAKKSGIHGEGSSVLLDDSDLSLDQGSGISLTGRSGPALTGPQSGIALDRVADSGMSLEGKPDDDSGLALFSDEDEDGITIDTGSGIALAADDDSGISLVADDDEGLTLDELPTADSGISLKDDDDDLQLTETMPAMKLPKGKKKPAESGMSDTMLEVPAFEEPQEEEAESDFEIGAADGGSQGDTSVLLFDDEDETDDGGAAMVKKKAPAEDEEEPAFEFSDDDEAAEEGEGGEAEDVFAGDEAFEEEPEFESEGEFETTAAKAAVGGAIEYPWGAGVISSLAVSSIVMILCGLASIDLVRSMWGHQGYSPANGWLIETLGGLFK